MTNPVGAKVTVNNQEVGITNVSGLFLPWKPDSIITISKDGYQTEKLSYQTAPRDTDISLKLKSALLLLTNPWGATVLVDGKPIGQTTREGLVVPWDGHVIQAQKPGYGAETIRLESAPVSTETVLELQPLASLRSPVRTMRWMEVAGYLVGGIALLFLPLLAYMATIGGSNDALLAQKITELDKKLRQSEAEKEDKEKSLQDLNKRFREEQDKRLRTDRENEGLNTRLKQTENERAQKDKTLEELYKRLQDEQSKRLRADSRITDLEQENLKLKRNAQIQPVATSPTRTVDRSKNERLINAVLGSRMQEVRSLLSQNADPKARSSDSYGYTALMYAVLNNQVEMVKLLLERGADPNTRGLNGKGAMDLAEGSSNRDQIRSLLRQYGGR